MRSTEVFTAVFKWYDEVCKKTQDCDECLSHVPRKDCFTAGDIEQLIAIARKYDIAHSDGGDCNA